MASSKAVSGPAGAPPRAVYFYLAVVVVSWAANWPLMKLALADAPPLVFASLRVAGTLALLLPALLVARAPLLPLRGERAGLFWVGQFQVALWVICGIIGLSIVPPGRAIVLAYTMPLWAILIGRWLRPDPLSRAQRLGAALGFAGLLLFLNPGLVDWGNARVLLGNGLLLLAAIGWAVGSCLYRRHTWRTPFWTQTFWQLAVSAVVVLAVAGPAAIGQTVHWTPALVAILAYNWVVTTAIGYFLWNKILAVLPAAVAGQVMAITPVGGFLLSAFLFGGAVTPGIIGSLVLIVGGIALTLRG